MKKTRPKTLPSQLKNQAGFTILETILSFAVFSMVALGMVQSYVMFENFWVDAEREMTLHNSGRMALDKITREVRGAQTVEISTISGDTELRVTRLDGNDAVFLYEPDLGGSPANILPKPGRVARDAAEAGAI